MKLQARTIKANEYTRRQSGIQLMMLTLALHSKMQLASKLILYHRRNECKLILYMREMGDSKLKAHDFCKALLLPSEL